MNKTVPRLIAVCGYKRSGKDTVANFISDTYGHEHIKIAAKLKNIVKTLFNFTEEQVETDSKEVVDNRWGVTPRHVMQFMGTEMFQYKIQELLPNIDRRFWIMNIINETRDKIDKGYPLIISDLRFKHEYMELQKYGVYIIRVNKNNIRGTDTHPSEVEFLDIPADLIINNDGSITDLYNSLKENLSNQTV